MIGRLQGTLLEKRAPRLLLEVHGVGYEVEAPMSTFYQLPQVGESTVLHTHLAVREDAHTLYGFASESERQLFRALIRVNGVGAKLALTILSGISPDGFVACVRHQDSAALVKLPGVGKKTAERLLVEMRDRLGESQPEFESGPGSTTAASMAPAGPIDDAVSALIALGYKAPEASRMVRGIDGAAGMPSEEIIRRALQGAVTR